MQGFPLILWIQGAARQGRTVGARRLVFARLTCSETRPGTDPAILQASSGKSLAVLQTAPSGSSGRDLYPMEECGHDYPKPVVVVVVVRIVPVAERATQRQGLPPLLTLR